MALVEKYILSELTNQINRFFLVDSMGYSRLREVKGWDKTL